MAKATRVHSTPRRSASKIDPPKPLTSDEKAARYQHLAEAYLRMEAVICDVNNMATLAQDAVMNDVGVCASKDTNSLAHFAVYHLVDMIRDLHKQYLEDDFERSEKAVV
jgi:hypothetical protein